jgi:carbon monoxide dehydrogenase subunit G
MALTRIYGNLISSATLTGNLIASATVTGDKIAVGTLTGNLIASATVTGDKIAVGTLTGNIFQAQTITGASIAANSIGSSNLTITGVASGTYGGATQIPVITVGTDGRVTYSANVSSGGPTQPPTPYTANAVVYAANTTALTTSSGLTYNGTALVAAGGIFKANGSPSLSAATAGEAILAPESGLGALLYGRGTTYDVVLGRRTTNVALGVLADTVNLFAGGSIKATSTISVGAATPSTSGAGITFPATQSTSSDANTLDDYEEGTFTPTILFGGNNTSMVLNRQYATYTKIGNRVFINMYVSISPTKGSSTGTATVAGLPFQNVNDGNGAGGAQTACAFNPPQILYSGMVTAYVENNATYIQLATVTEAGFNSGMSDTNFQNNSVVQIMCHYQTS